MADWTSERLARALLREAEIDTDRAAELAQEIYQ